MAAKHEVEAKFTLKDEMSVQLENIRKRAAALEKDAKALVGETGKVQGKFSDLTKGIEKFSPGLGSVISRVQGLTSGLSPLAIGLGVTAGAITAAAGAAALATKELVAMGDRLTNLSRVTQISTDGLQQLEAFGRPLGITLDQMAAASTKLEKELGEGGKGVNAALKALGLNMEALQRLSPGERLLTVAKAAAQIKSPVEQAAASSQLLGRAWADLRLDADSIKEGEQSIRDTTIVTNEALKAGDALGDSWSTLWTNMKNTAVENSQGIAEVLNTLVVNFSFAAERISEFRKVEEEAARLAGGPKQLQIADATGQGDAFRKEAQNNLRLTTLLSKNLAEAQRDIEARLRPVVKTQEEITEETNRAKKAQEEWNRVLERAIPLSREFYKFQLQAINIATEIPNLASSRFDLSATLPGVGPGRVDPFSAVNPVTGRGRIPIELLAKEAGFDELGETIKEFSFTLQDASDIAQVFGDTLGPFGEALNQGAAAADLLSRSFKENTKEIEDWGSALVGLAAGVMSVFNATGSGGTGSRVAGGALAGASAGSAFGPFGAIFGGAAGALTGLFRGLGGPDIGRDVGRDIGANISEELEKAIEESGQNAQMFLREIFEEGGLGIDRFAEEVGDLFSFFERGEITEGGLLTELEETLPILIENFEELGPAGEEQLNRIIAAAKEMGIDLGEAGDQLERLQKGIPEMTLEDFTSKFDLTPEQQAKLQGLGLGIQTEEERVADELNVPLELLSELAPALETLGISLEELPEFLEDTGLDLEELGLKLELPPELQAQLEALGPPDPKTQADANAQALGPAFNDLGSRFDRLGDRIERAVRDALSQNS